MKQLYFFFIGACMLIFQPSQSQEFDLSDYRLPVLKRKLLETNFQFSGANQQLKMTETFNSERNISNMNGYFNLRYNSYLNSPSRQKEVNGYGSLYGSFQKDKENEATEKQQGFSPRVILNAENRWYKGKRFIEMDYALLYERDHSKIKSEFDREFNQTMAAFSIPLKIGRGRIEQVQDARHALYILSELALQDRLPAGKSHEEIIAMAEHISRLKNKRFFDYRHRRIYEIESMDSFLRANNTSLNTDARYFTTLYDFWEFGSYPVRRAGTRFSFVVNPGIFYVKEKSDNDFSLNDYNQRFWHASTGFEIVHEKPMNLSWQNSVSFSVYYSLYSGEIKDNTDDSKTKMIFPNASISLNQSFGYYPNTRTSVIFGYGVGYINVFDASDAENSVQGAKNQIFISNAGLDINYYISPRFRFTGSFSAEYFKKDNNNTPVFLTTDLQSSQYTFYEKSFRTNLSAGFVYSIF